MTLLSPETPPRYSAASDDHETRPLILIYDSQTSSAASLVFKYRCAAGCTMAAVMFDTDNVIDNRPTTR